ncbi:PIR Superfamily Protein [Plasmodium ovale curtisi]|uniref:PIR Superfamily Protein n=1 Tax=Plasmodium ovale curtisi TaxID=864141 RepID=A0A1A8WMV2_PLAOA|nr:PIR Superfamily Protein [Plasmodium ovale curtisi]SBT01964.1 PIR Superfamily Protein [Plasmodium ovale curtisi]
MTINSRRLKKSSEICKKLISESINDKSNTLCVNNNGTDSEVTNKLKKIINNGILSDLRFNLFSPLLNECYSKGVYKFSVSMELLHVLILQVLLVKGTAASLGTSPESNPASQEMGFPKESFFENPGVFTTKFVKCIFLNKDSKCIQYGIAFLAVFAAALSALGAIYNRICKCCWGSTEQPAETENDGEVDYREQLEKMQQEHEELRKKLMERRQMCKDEMKDEENNNSSKRMDESEKSNSKSGNIGIGYQKIQE